MLVVEDDPGLQKALVEKFKHEGFSVISTGDGKGVLALTVAEKPDGIVLDLMLPNKDGMSILEVLRSPEVDVQVPVVILTNLAGRSGLREDAEALNAQYFDKSSTKIEDVVDALVTKL